MFVAEELQCDWNKVRVEPISFNRNTREGNLYLGATGHLVDLRGRRRIGRRR